MEEARDTRRTSQHTKLKRRARSVVWSENVAEQAKKISETLSPRRTGLRNIAPDNSASTSDSGIWRNQDSKSARLFQRITVEGLYILETTF